MCTMIFHISISNFLLYSLLELSTKEQTHFIQVMAFMSVGPTFQVFATLGELTWNLKYLCHSTHSISQNWKVRYNLVGTY